MSDFEQQWAVALKKGQTQTKQQKAVPLSIKKKQAKEEFNYYKRVLIEACENKDQISTDKYLDLLMKTRAQITALLLQEIKEKQGEITEYKLKEATKNYYKDCLKMIRATAKLMQ